MPEDSDRLTSDEKCKAAQEPRTKKIRLKKQSKRSTSNDASSKLTAPTSEMHAAVVNALEREMDSTEYPEMKSYMKNLEAVLFKTYPSDTGSPEFSGAFVKRLRSLRSRKAMVAFYLCQHHRLKETMNDTSALDQNVLSYLCTCPLEVLATPDERMEIDAIRNDMLEKRLTAGALICSKCGKIGKGHLNLNLMGLEQNNHWTNLFEENMCQCTQ